MRESLWDWIGDQFTKELTIKEENGGNRGDLVVSLAAIYILYTIYEHASSFFHPFPLFILCAGQGRKNICLGFLSGSSGELGWKTSLPWPERLMKVTCKLNTKLNNFVKL